MEVGKNIIFYYKWSRYTWTLFILS